MGSTGRETFRTRRHSQTAQDHRAANSALAMTASDGSEGPTDSTVLVTGGAGFIGSHLVDALVPDNTVRVVDDLSSGNRENVHREAQFVEGDLRERSTVEAVLDGVDVVFHQAGLVSVETSVENPTESHAINAGATVTLLDAARQVDARVITASSAAIYGAPSSVPVRESEPLTPRSPYAIDKLTVDQYTRRFADLYGLETVALRYFNVYGPGQGAASYSGVISTFLDQAATGRPMTVHGDGSQTRDFVHVSDVVQANLLAATSDCAGTAYNVGTGQEITIAALAETVSSLAGGIEITHVEGRPGDVPRSRADITRAREELGFEPTVDLREGLAGLMADRRPSERSTPAE